MVKEIGGVAVETLRAHASRYWLSVRRVLARDSTF